MHIRPLRDYQLTAIDALRDEIRAGHKRIVLQLATGLGKTRLAGEIVKMATAKGNKALFAAPAIILVDQTIESFESDGIENIGAIQSNHPRTDYSAQVQVASADTLARRYTSDGMKIVQNGLKIVIIDECHVHRKGIYAWLNSDSMKDAIIIGLSATPWSKGMAKFWQRLVIIKTISEGIDDGYLADFRSFAPSHPDLSSVKTTLGDYDESQASEVMGASKLIANIVSTWIKQADNQPTICFCVNRAHARKVQLEFEQAGIPCGYVDGDTTKKERKEIEEKFHSGEYLVVANVGVLVTGVDWVVRCIILAAPTKSEMRFVQAIGRGLRPEYAPGFDLTTREGRLAAIAAGPKPDGLLILDHASVQIGNKDSLGFVTDIHYHDLDDDKVSNAQRKRKERKERVPKECPKCHFIKPPGALVCPSCGFKPEKQSTIEEAEGELVEVRRGKGTKGDAPKNHVKVCGEFVPMADFYGMLKFVGRERGYSTGWAANQYKKATKTWPNYYRDAPELPPSQNVIRWIKAQAIRYAKGRNSWKTKQQ